LEKLSDYVKLRLEQIGDNHTIRDFVWLNLKELDRSILRNFNPETMALHEVIVH